MQPDRAAGGQAIVNLDAAHAGHAQVGDDRVVAVDPGSAIGAVQPEHLERFAAIPRFFDQPSAPFQEPADRDADRRLIVDHQHPAGNAPSSGTSPAGRGMDQIAGGKRELAAPSHGAPVEER